MMPETEILILINLKWFYSKSDSFATYDAMLFLAHSDNYLTLILLGPSVLHSPFSLEELGGRQIEVVATRSLHENFGYGRRIYQGKKRRHCQLHPEESQNPQCLCLQVHLLRVPQPGQCHRTDVSHGRLLQRIFHHLWLRSSDHIQHSTREAFWSHGQSFP